MAKARRSRRPRTTLVILVLVSVTIITLDARGGFGRLTSGVKSVASDAFAPVRSAVDGVIEPVGSFLAGSVHYGAVRQQNQKLRDEINRLKLQGAQASQAEAAMKQLSALLHLPWIGSLQSVPSQVVNYNTSNFASTIDINTGRDNGVQLGMPVVAAGGLVGKVVQANHHTSTVRLITDGASTIGAVFGTAPGSFATVTGQGSGRPLVAGLVPAGTTVSPGELFSTSGLNGAVFPAAIPIARVIRARGGVNSAQESIVLQPVVDLSHLRYVAVVQWGPSTP